MGIEKLRNYGNNVDLPLLEFLGGFAMTIAAIPFATSENPSSGKIITASVLAVVGIGGMFHSIRRIGQTEGSHL